MNRSVTKRTFSIAKRYYGHMKPGHKASESPLSTAFKLNDNDDDNEQPRRFSSDSLDKPNLMSLHKRWDKMDAVESEEIIIYLDDRCRGDWRNLTDEEKKAVWFVNYGPWGPRAARPDDPGKIYGQLGKVVLGVMLGVSGYKGYEMYSSGSGSGSDSNSNSKQD